MSTPKRHHYVPQMILNGFTDGDGWLHWCRLGQQPLMVRPARPSELFLEKHLYSTVSEAGIKDPTMERALSSLETEAARVVNKIVTAAREGQCPNLSSDEKRIWYLFFLMQWRRTPESQRAVASDAEATRMLDDALNELRTALPGRRAEIDALSTAAAKARTVRNVRIDTLKRLSSDVMGVLEQRGIGVLRITKPNKSFIVGSRPVVKITPPGHTDLHDPIVEMWLPIASDIAAGVGRGEARVSLHYLTDEKPIRRLNVAIVRQSGTIAASSPALVQSLARRR